MYNISYFINKFENIPEEDWIIGQYTSNLNKNNHCALGHCGSNGGHTLETIDLEQFSLLLNITLKEKSKFVINRTRSHGSYGIIPAINDGETLEYQQSTPKQRILAALYDIKKLSEPRVKEKIVYKTVQVDSKIKQLVKELELN